MKRSLGLIFLLAAAALRADGLMEANSLYKLGMYPEAMAAYEPLANDSSQSAGVRAQAWQGAGNCALQLKDKDKAKADYDHALELNPNNAVLQAYVSKMWPVAAAAPAPAPEAAAAVHSSPASTSSASDSWAEAGLKSAVLPGWAQYSRGETTKGSTLGILAFTTWIFYAWSYNDASAKISKYNSYAAEAASLKAAGQPYDAYRPDGAYREANVAQLTNTVALGALITVYGVSIWDAVRGTPSVKKAMFSLTPRGDGVEVAYARHF